ncbi:hypothetical protein RND81_04G061800 [Saponaria officinalis]|uniref:Uncharacterized protein n=1 Tax=Saponaria officinalis TaxID=3572 RepID=A0AAW1LCW6_SAPOF
MLISYFLDYFLCIFFSCGSLSLQLQETCTLNFDEMTYIFGLQVQNLEAFRILLGCFFYDYKSCRKFCLLLWGLTFREFSY